MSRIKDLNQYIDQTLLAPTISREQVITFCEEAITHDFKTVCIPPYYVDLAYQVLSPSRVDVCTVIGFPLGYNTTANKQRELLEAINNGAAELDIVLNQGMLKSADGQLIRDEMQQLNELAHRNYTKTKWIVETAYLNEEELAEVCNFCMETSADFIKTSTGFAGAGAQLEHVKKWKSIIGDHDLQIKASGGIKSKADALSFIEAGATRLGCSSGVQILNNK